jgi:MFS family permease
MNDYNSTYTINKYSISQNITNKNISTSKNTLLNKNITSNKNVSSKNTNNKNIPSKKDSNKYAMYIEQKNPSKNSNKSEYIDTCYYPEKSMNVAIKEGASFSIMDGFTSNFITPFALALNAGNGFISILSTLPSLLAAFSQLSVNWILRLFPKRKFLIILGILLQAFTWLPLVLLPYIIPAEQNHLRLFLLFIIITLNAIFSALISPIWISMMGDIVPQNTRGKYFGKRNSIIGGVSFVATFIAGFTLNYLSPIIGLTLTFSLMFLIAFIARLGSGYLFTKMEEPPLVMKKVDESNLISFLKKIKTDDYGVFVMYICAFGFAVNIASPFFTVYMLKDLQFSYTQFTLITSASIIFSFLTMKFWGRISDEVGTKKIMFLTGLLIPFIPLIWIFTTNFYMIFLIESFSGIVWAGFNLSSSNYVYDATDPHNRTKNVAYLNILRGILVFIGASIGGFLSTHLPTFGLGSSILVVFIVSAIIKIISFNLFPNQS